MLINTHKYTQTTNYQKKKEQSRVTTRQETNVLHYRVEGYRCPAEFSFVANKKENAYLSYSCEQTVHSESLQA